MPKPFTILLIMLVALTVTNCGRSGDNSESPTAETPAASPRANASPLSDLEEKLKFIRNGQFTYIYVISRKDGKQLDPQDSSFLRTNAPQVVDWVVTDDKTKAIGGTNFNLEEGNLNVIKKRLVVEDYSGR
jgi:hypothetical protein